MMLLWLGGMGSMSNVPKYLPDGSRGSRLGHDAVVDEVSSGRGKPSVLVDKDDGLGKLKKLRPSFKEDGGSVTAGNASSISVSGEKAIELGLHVIAKIRGYADAAQAPELFTTMPETETRVYQTNRK
uniref:Thiolase N-terminal domain-containing protein n=1 Tax=Brassica campestris TaxID=3711 RepID=M4E055_BRACM